MHLSDSLRAERSGDQSPVGAKFSAPVQTGSGAQSSSSTMDDGIFFGKNSCRGMALTTNPI